MSLEQCNIAVQTVLPDDKIPAGISLTVLARSIGGSLAIAISQNVFEQKLRQGLSKSLPDLDPSIVSGSGATNLISNVQSAVGGNQAVVQMVCNFSEHFISSFGHIRRFKCLGNSGILKILANSKFHLDQAMLTPRNCRSLTCVTMRSCRRSWWP